MKCQLHNEEAELRVSHIIPKFVYKWIKQTGVGRLRQRHLINTPLQDGIKQKMLCGKCEQKFSKSENWFHNNVFHKYLNDPNYEIENSKQLFEFCISISWRVLKFFKDDGANYIHLESMNEAELEWRNFLLNNTDCTNFKNHHLILISDNFYSNFDSEVYFSRSIDVEIAEGEEKCFIYSKFAKFMIISEIAGMNENEIIGSNLREEFILSSKDQSILNDHIWYFF